MKSTSTEYSTVSVSTSPDCFSRENMSYLLDLEEEEIDHVPSSGASHDFNMAENRGYLAPLTRKESDGYQQAYVLDETQDERQIEQALIQGTSSDVNI